MCVWVCVFLESSLLISVLLKKHLYIDSPKCYITFPKRIENQPKYLKHPCHLKSVCCTQIILSPPTILFSPTSSCLSVSFSNSRFTSHKKSAIFIKVDFKAAESVLIGQTFYFLSRFFCPKSLLSKNYISCKLYLHVLRR